MYLLFLDESGTPPTPAKAAGQYTVIAGVIIPEGAWHAVAKGLLDTKRKYRVEGEIKWKHFGRGNNDSRSAISHLSFEEKDNLRSEIFRLITARKAIKLISCVTCSEAAYAMPTVINQGDIYHLTYKGVTERFQYFLQDVSREIGSPQFGMVISDHRMSADDARLRKHHHELIEMAGPYSAIYANIIETIHFAPSDFSAGLQLADMAAGAIHRAFQHSERRFCDEIAPAFRRSARGVVAGYGLVRMPAARFIEPPGGGAFAPPMR